MIGGFEKVPCRHVGIWSV